ncbi:MAG: hypothetical protein KAU14_05320, partial [Thermoplasmata archaeon]|nr:hypothetical protein [Thermoplasmata archaeon]
MTLRNKLHSRIWSIILLGVLVLSSTAPFYASEEELDSDHDGWSDEYERSIGTDPFNPDTDGDGIEDPDDPTPKGSLINEEEIWETFEVEVEPSQKFSTVDEDIGIEVRVEKNGIPIAGRKVWLFIYLDDDGFEKVEEKSGILSDGKANFSFQPGKAGSYAFLAIVNRSAVSPGREISYGEMNQIQQRKQGGYVYFTVFPHYKTTISSHYRNILAGQKGRFFIRKWGYSRDLAA